MLLGLSVSTAAQSVTPMRGVVRGVADQFALRVTVGNPYDTPKAFLIRLYDENFQPVPGVIFPPVLRLFPNDTRQVTARIAFDGQSQRKIRLCAEAFSDTSATTTIRTQVCGRFLAQHVSAP